MRLMSEKEAWEEIRDVLYDFSRHLPDFMEEEDEERLNRAINLLTQYFENGC